MVTVTAFLTVMVPLKFMIVCATNALTSPFVQFANVVRIKRRTVAQITLSALYAFEIVKSPQFVVVIMLLCSNKITTLNSLKVTKMTKRLTKEAIKYVPFAAPNATKNARKVPKRGIFK